jgi:hypothetical protein
MYKLRFHSIGFDKEPALIRADQAINILGILDDGRCYGSVISYSAKQGTSMSAKIPISIIKDISEFDTWIEGKNWKESGDQTGVLIESGQFITEWGRLSTRVIYRSFIQSLDNLNEIDQKFWSIIAQIQKELYSQQLCTLPWFN